MISEAIEFTAWVVGDLHMLIFRSIASDFLSPYGYEEDCRTSETLFCYPSTLTAVDGGFVKFKVDSKTHKILVFEKLCVNL